MPLGEQDGQGEPDRLGLALDDRLHGRTDAVRHPYQLVKGAAAAFPGIKNHFALSLGCSPGVPGFWRTARPRCPTDRANRQYVLLGNTREAAARFRRRPARPARPLWPARDFPAPCRLTVPALWCCPAFPARPSWPCPARRRLGGPGTAGPPGSSRAAYGPSGGERVGRCGGQSALTVGDCGVQWSAVGLYGLFCLGGPGGAGSGGERRCFSALTRHAWTTRGECSCRRNTAKTSPTGL